MTTAVTRADEPSGGAAAAPPGWGEFDLVIQPSRSWSALRLGEVWAYRELLYFLA